MRAGGCWMVAAAALLVMACGDDPPAQNRSLPQRGVGGGPALQSQALAPSPGSSGETARPGRRPRVYAPDRPEPTAEGNEEAPQLAGGATSEEQAGPTLEERLREAFGNPNDCLALAGDDLPDRLSIPVEVQVSITGRVTRASVSARSLGEEAQACLQAHAEHLNLGAVEGAPRTIRTTARYDVSSTPGETTVSWAPNRPLMNGELAPDRTLPAAMTEENRPAGSVNPDTTLPAMTEGGRPAGFVAPSSTLPAVAE